MMMRRYAMQAFACVALVLLCSELALSVHSQSESLSPSPSHDALDVLPTSSFRFAAERALRDSKLSSNCPPGAIVKGARCVCAAGFYGDAFGENCKACPAFSSSAVDSRTQSQCKCQPGYEFLGRPRDPLVCTPCNLGAFKNETSNGVCKLCPRGSTTKLTAQSQCLCVEGFYANKKGKCKRCSVGATSPFNSKSKKACICQPGYYGIKGSCLPCYPGTYSDVGWKKCEACPPGSDAPFPAAPRCYCKPGFFGDDMFKCSRCTRGSTNPECLPCQRISTEVGSSCKCAPNQYGDLFWCKPCPNGTVSDGWSSSIANCLCADGMYGIGPTCKACAANAITTNKGASCTCGADFYGDGMNYCKACPAFSSTFGKIGAKSKSDCSCKPGYEFKSGRCVPCGRRHYKDTKGNGVCRKCAANAVGVPAQAGTSCGCREGYFGDGFSCKQCPGGSMNHGTGNLGLDSCKCVRGSYRTASGRCEACPRGTFSDREDADSCISCGTSAVSVAPGYGNVGYTACQCAKGFYGPNYQTCMPIPANSTTSRDGTNYECAAGFYRNKVNDEICRPCPAGTFSPAGSYEGGCMSCLAPAVPNAAKTNCTCPAGFYTGNSPDGSVPQDDDLKCVACPKGSTSAGGFGFPVAACSCAKGHYGSSGAKCDVCPTGSTSDGHPLFTKKRHMKKTFTTTVANCGCENNFYGVAGNCTACPGGTKTRPFKKHDTLASCACDAGSTWDAKKKQCVACPSGTYKSAIGNRACKACPAGSQPSNPKGGATSCVCSIGFYGSKGVCTACPAYSTTESTGSLDINSCVCAAGYFQASGDESYKCSACPNGQYSATLGAQACTKCAEGTSSLFPTASTGCKCPPGEAGALGQCVKCVAPSVVSADGTVCTCDAGYEGKSASTCTPCASGSFKDTVGFGQCLACAAGSTSTTSSASTSCVCDIGFYADADNGGACTACLPRSTTRALGSSGKSSCECAPGYFKSWGGQARFIYRKSGIEVAPCDVCPTGRFASGHGSTECSICPTGNVNPSRTKCFCERQRYGSVNVEDGSNTCQSCPTKSLCPIGKECLSLTDCACEANMFMEGENCVACPRHSTAPVGSTSRSACKCDDGFVLDAATGACVGRPCPTLKRIEHATASALTGSAGDDVTFTCEAGYTLIGSKTLICGQDRKWSGELPKCVGNPCPKLRAPGNSTYTALAGGTGDKVSFTCKPGFSMLGSATLTCKDDATWDAPAPRCLPNACSAVTVPGNGTASASIGYTGDVVTFKCNDGFSLVGSSTTVCKGGDWSTETPTCRANVCPTLDVPDNGKLSAVSGNVGDVVTVTCESGYTMIGPKVLKCLGSGKWSYSTPVCFPNSCPAILPPANGFVTRAGGVTGESISFSCAPGYTLKGASSSRCLTSGKWTAEPPQCIASSCPVVKAPAFGSASADYGVVGGSILFTCQAGYTLLGSASIDCSTNLTYSAPVPTCSANPCVLLQCPKHGSCSNTLGYTGDVITFTCDSGYMLDDAAATSTKCLANGAWSRTVPKCIPAPPPKDDASAASFRKFSLKGAPASVLPPIPDFSAESRDLNSAIVTPKVQSCPDGWTCNEQGVFPPADWVNPAKKMKHSKATAKVKSADKPTKKATTSKKAKKSTTAKKTKKVKQSKKQGKKAAVSKKNKKKSAAKKSGKKAASSKKSKKSKKAQKKAKKAEKKSKKSKKPTKAKKGKKSEKKGKKTEKKAKKGKKKAQKKGKKAEKKAKKGKKATSKKEKKGKKKSAKKAKKQSGNKKSAKKAKKGKKKSAKTAKKGKKKNAKKAKKVVSSKPKRKSSSKKAKKQSGKKKSGSKKSKKRGSKKSKKAAQKKAAQKKQKKSTSSKKKSKKPKKANAKRSDKQKNKKKYKKRAN